MFGSTFDERTGLSLEAAPWLLRLLTTAGAGAVSAAGATCLALRRHNNKQHGTWVATLA